MEIRFTLYGTPVPKKYKRTRGGKLYLSPDTEIWELSVSNALRLYYPTEVFYSVFCARYVFYFKSDSSLLIQSPDLDNLCKSVTDGLQNALLFSNDTEQGDRNMVALIAAKLPTTTQDRVEIYLTDEIDRYIFVDSTGEQALCQQ